MGKSPPTSRTLQEFNRGLFDYLIATDAPAGANASKRQAAQKGQGEAGAPKGKKRRRGEEGAAEFGVTRGVDFKGVATVVNVDPPADVTGCVTLVILSYSEYCSEESVSVLLCWPASGALFPDLLCRAGCHHLPD